MLRKHPAGACSMDSWCLLSAAAAPMLTKNNPVWEKGSLRKSAHYDVCLSNQTAVWKENNATLAFHCKPAPRSARDQFLLLTMAVTNITKQHVNTYTEPGNPELQFLPFLEMTCVGRRHGLVKPAFQLAPTAQRCRIDQHTPFEALLG